MSSKVGNAVERNRVKRWVREAWRSVAADLPAVDLVVIARPARSRAGLPGVRARPGRSARDRSRGGSAP